MLKTTLGRAITTRAANNVAKVMEFKTLSEAIAKSTLFTGDVLRVLKNGAVYEVVNTFTELQLDNGLYLSLISDKGLRVLNNISEMKLANLKVNEVVHLIGGRRAGDGINQLRIISSSQNELSIPLMNGLFANLTKTSDAYDFIPSEDEDIQELFKDKEMIPWLTKTQDYYNR